MAITIPDTQSAIYILEALNAQIDNKEMLNELKPLFNNIATQYNAICTQEDDKYSLYVIEKSVKNKP